MIKKLLFFTIITVVIFSRNGWTAFNEIGAGARPIGMGDAFVAIADDGNAINYNVGGLGRMDNIYIGLTKAIQFAGLVNYNQIGLVLPLGRIGTLGASFGLLSEGSDIYREEEWILSYGRSFSMFSTGISLKFFGTKFNENIESVKNNPYFAKTSTSALSIDWGLLVQPVKGLSAGFFADNLLPADVSISEEEEDEVLKNIGLGLAYKLEAIASAAQQKSMRELLSRTQCAMEIDLRNRKPELHAGAEIGVHESFTIRGGYTTKSSVNSQIGDNSTVSFGASLTLSVQSVSLRLDYAFQMLMGELQDGTSHRISTNLFF